MKSITMIPIASGSSGNCMYLRFNDHKILIDLGVAYKWINSALNKHDINIEDIEAVFITHTHNDHIGGFKVTAKRLNCFVYTSKTVRDILGNKIVKGLALDETADVNDDLEVTIFKTSHDSPGSCGFIFESGDIKIGYVTDSGFLSSTIRTYLEGSDMVIIEANHDIEMLKKGPYPYFLKQRILSQSGHLSNAESLEVCSALKTKGTKVFCFGHLSRENNDPRMVYELMHDNLGDEVKIHVLSPRDDNIYTFEIQ